MVCKFLAFIFILLPCCSNSGWDGSTKSILTSDSMAGETAYFNPYKKITDIPLPRGFFRITNPPAFARWLGKLDLKRDKTVLKFDRTLKENQQAQFAVLDISVGTKDLQQCADAVMRLRAEYLFDAGEFNSILFKDYNNTAYRFQKPYSRNNFERYLEKVFGMCGSASLAKQLHQHVEMEDIAAGDVLIRGGFPGHAVIVMDVAVNRSGQKIYLLAQSYMPAQDIHILLNPISEQPSPWYQVTREQIIQTPEYLFNKNELKRW